MRTRFAAPWSPAVRNATLTAAVLLLLVAAVSGLWGRVLAVAAVAAMIAWSVRGYDVRGGEVRVLRIGWRRRIALAGLRTARVAPGVTAGSVRRGGIGGILGFIGRFENETLGPYRAYVTDPERCVVLVLTDRTVVVSPDDPEAFVAAVQRELGSPPPDDAPPLEPGSEVELS